MDQLFELAVNTLDPEEMSYPELPVMSPDEIDGYLAAVENQPPIPSYSEVKKLLY